MAGDPVTSAAEQAEAWVEYLNGLLEQDPKWVSALFLRRERCNYLIATREHLPVENDSVSLETRTGCMGRQLKDIPKPVWSAGYLGLLNGFIGPGLGDYPLITAVIDPTKKVIERFALTEDLFKKRFKPITPEPAPDPEVITPRHETD